MARHSNSKKSDESIGNVDRLLQEINMLRMERYLFSSDRQRSSTPGEQITFTDGEGKKYTIELGSFGQPGDLSYRVFQAVMYQVVQNGRACVGDVCSFRSHMAASKRQLTRLCGRSWSGKRKDNDDYHKAIMALHTTRISMEWYDKKTDTTKWESFYPFISAFFAAPGDGTNDQSAVKGFENFLVAVHPFILESYNAGYFRTFNMARLLQLRCTGQMLYKSIFLIFGYLHQKGVAHPRYEKDYEVICRDWLNQPPRRYLAHIKRHLNDHLEGLVKVGLCRRAEIAPKKDGKGFKLIFVPGEGFYADYPLYLETVAAHLPMRMPDLSEHEAYELLAYFHEKLGRRHGEFRPKELEQGRDFLKRYNLQEGKDLIDYALEKKAKNVEPQVFGFILGYLPTWSAEKGERMEKRAWREKIATCRFCNEQGFLSFLDRGTSRVYVCPHDREKIMAWKERHGYVVQALNA